MARDTHRMTATLPRPARIQTPDHAGPVAPTPARCRSLSWKQVGVLGMVGLAAVLNVIWLDRQTYGNAYYAAVVKSMLTSWSAFFPAFDGGGFVTVDSRWPA